MKAEAKLVRELFEGEQCLVVPVFQRPYVWDRVRNWEPLWSDILTMAEAHSQQSEPEPHFLGAVVLDSTDKGAADISVLQVIDGQQRITTLQIAMCAVRDAFKTAEVDRAFVRTLHKLVCNEDQLSTADFAPYKVWPTLRDRRVFAGIVDHSPTADSDSRLSDAYQFFFEQTLTWLTENDLDRGRIQSLVNALRAGLQLVVIELSSKSDNAQVIFESLNDRGTPLLPSDLVKNSLFQQLERVGTDVERVFDDYWRRLETDFWQTEIRQGRLIRTRVDAFFAHYLTMRTGEEVLTTNLFTRFKELCQGMGREELEALTAEIATCSDLYRGMVERTAPNPHDHLLETAETLDTTVVSPVVLYLDQHAAEEDRREAFAHLESWLVRRALLRSTSKNYNRMLLELLKELRGSTGPFADTVRDFFQRNTSESGRWPTDDEVRETLVAAPIFKNLTRARLRMVLRGCEIGLVGSDDAEPELSASDYALLASADDPVDDALRYTLGNLTLSTRTKELSKAAGWTDRRGILSASRLQLNRSLPESISDVRLTIRAARLAEGFCRSWPHPDSSSDPVDHSATSIDVPDDSTHTSGWVDDAWNEIQRFFADLPVGSVSRLEDRVSVTPPTNALMLNELAAIPTAGYEFRDIAGTLYIEKTADHPADAHSLGRDPADQQPTAPLESSEARTRTVHEESVTDLIRAGLIREDDRIVHDQPRKGRSFTARINRAGRILVGSREFPSLSSALSHLTGSSRNGWKDWRLERTGETLEQVRERFRRRADSQP